MAANQREYLTQKDLQQIEALKRIYQRVFDVEDNGLPNCFKTTTEEVERWYTRPLPGIIKATQTRVYASGVTSIVQLSNSASEDDSIGHFIFRPAMRFVLQEAKSYCDKRAQRHKLRRGKKGDATHMMLYEFCQWALRNMNVNDVDLARWYQDQGELDKRINYCEALVPLFPQGSSSDITTAATLVTIKNRLKQLKQNCRVYHESLSVRNHLQSFIQTAPSVIRQLVTYLHLCLRDEEVPEATTLEALTGLVNTNAGRSLAEMMSRQLGQLLRHLILKTECVTACNLTLTDNASIPAIEYPNQNTESEIEVFLSLDSGLCIILKNPEILGRFIQLSQNLQHFAEYIVCCRELDRIANAGGEILLSGLLMEDGTQHFVSMFRELQNLIQQNLELLTEALDKMSDHLITERGGHKLWRKNLHRAKQHGRAIGTRLSQCNEMIGSILSKSRVTVTARDVIARITRFENSWCKLASSLNLPLPECVQSRHTARLSSSTAAIVAVTVVGSDHEVSSDSTNSRRRWSSSSSSQSISLAHALLPPPLEQYEARLPETYTCGSPVSQIMQWSANVFIYGTTEGDLYLHQYPNDQVLVTRKHQGKINALIKMDDEQLITVADDGCVICWVVDWNENSIIFQHALQEHGAAINCATKLSSRTVAIGSNDCTIKIFGITDGETQEMVTNAAIMSLTCCHNTLIAGTYIGRIITYQLDTESQQYHQQSHFSNPYGKLALARPILAISDTCFVVSESNSEWSITEQLMRGPLKYLKAYQFYTYSRPSVDEVFLPASRQCIGQHSKPICVILTTPSENLIIIGSTDGLLRVWDIKENTFIQSIQFARPISTACLTNGGQLIVGFLNSPELRRVDMPKVMANNHVNVVSTEQDLPTTATTTTITNAL